MSRFGTYGGQYVPETLMNALIELEAAYGACSRDEAFLSRLAALYRDYAHRPSLLTFASNMTRDLGGAKVFLKREDLNHTGSHKINNCLGQALLAEKMGKKRLIAETGAGQHGVAAATVAAFFKMDCEVFMGGEDMRRQALNVYRMRLLGARVTGSGGEGGTLKDAVSDALRRWAGACEDTHYLIGSCMGPHPFPVIVRDFQKIIGAEAREQILNETKRLPAAVYACVGGGSNAIGVFHAFIGDETVKLYGAEAGGRGVDAGEHAATMTRGRTGVFHGMKSLFLQNAEGQIAPVYSISAGLDYPGVGPEHASLKERGRAEYFPVTDAEAVEAFKYLARREGVICAIESAHAVSLAMKHIPKMSPDEAVIICVSGRGDKDVAEIEAYEKTAEKA